jgi:hypothetical protein
MELDLSDRMKGILQILLLLVLPWVAILSGMALSVQNVWYFVLAITWFGCGVVFYSALH